MSEYFCDSLNQNLSRIFALFAEKNLHGALKSSQAEFVIDEMLRELRRRTTPKVYDLPDDVTFQEFLNLLLVIFPDREQLQIAADRVFERYVDHVISKGFLLFRRCSRKRVFGCLPRGEPDWKFVWCTILPGIIEMQKENGKMQIIRFDDDTAIEAPTACDEKLIWTIINGDQESQEVYQFAHMDPILAQLFVKDMRTCRDHLTREQLADHDHKRSYRCDENRERRQLQDERNRLESELEAERQNRKDEEIVRGLTTRLLKQEIQKSEKMEQVIAELQTKLGYEMVEAEEEVIEEAETEIVIPSREQQIQQYAYHLYTTHSDQPVTSDDEEAWKQNYNLIVSTQSV